MQGFSARADAGRRMRAKFLVNREPGHSFRCQNAVAAKPPTDNWLLVPHLIVKHLTVTPATIKESVPGATNEFVNTRHHGIDADDGTTSRLD